MLINFVVTCSSVLFLTGLQAPHRYYWVFNSWISPFCCLIGRKLGNYPQILVHFKKIERLHADGGFEEGAAILHESPRLGSGWGVSGGGAELQLSVGISAPEIREHLRGRRVPWKVNETPHDRIDFFRFYSIIRSRSFPLSSIGFREVTIWNNANTRMTSGYLSQYHWGPFQHPSSRIGMEIDPWCTTADYLCPKIYGKSRNHWQDTWPQFLVRVNARLDQHECPRKNISCCIALLLIWMLQWTLFSLSHFFPKKTMDVFLT